ncbi:hypothetical protein ACIPL1_00010 [Pseudomonas sp. NPDC090202]|uniref:hypothetical protein n=1 Tax=Pseudomonas sp. NPDC090202 TaxID=3364476 RepID=UPI00380D12D7
MFTKTFSEAGDFQALFSAQKWLDAHGYSYGSTCRGSPTGILKGEFFIAKWRNLSHQQIEELDGQMSGDNRNGPVTVTLKHAQAA